MLDSSAVFVHSGITLAGDNDAYVHHLGPDACVVHRAPVGIQLSSLQHRPSSRAEVEEDIR